MKLPGHILFYMLVGIVLLLVGVAAHNLYEINRAIDRLEYLKKYQSNTYTINQDNYQSIQIIDDVRINEN